MKQSHVKINAIWKQKGIRKGKESCLHEYRSDYSLGCRSEKWKRTKQHDSVRKEVIIENNMTVTTEDENKGEMMILKMLKKKVN